MIFHTDPDNKVHGANMGPTWVLSAPDGPHVGPMNLAIRGEEQSHVLKMEQYVCLLHDICMYVLCMITEYIYLYKQTEHAWWEYVNIFPIDIYCNGPFYWFKGMYT